MPPIAPSCPMTLLHRLAAYGRQNTLNVAESASDRLRRHRDNANAIRTTGGAWSGSADRDIIRLPTPRPERGLSTARSHNDIRRSNTWTGRDRCWCYPAA